MREGQPLWSCERACGLDQALPTGPFALAAPCPLPVLAQAKAETTSLGGPAACHAGGAGHRHVWERNPELIKSFFPPLALTYPCTSIGPVTL